MRATLFLTWCALLSACTVDAVDGLGEPPMADGLSEQPGVDETPDRDGKADEPCRFRCEDYRYTAGLCLGGWYCDGACISYTGCTAECRFPCGAYGYGEGDCHGGWLCEDGCIERTGCTVDPDGGGGSGGGGTTSCPDWRCSGDGCRTLVALQGSSDPASARAREDGYFIATEARYAFIRRDLALLLAHAACEVGRRFEGTTPLGVSDLSQVDGRTPGSDSGWPRHPTTTHTGSDLDLAYYQTDGRSEPQIVCGDGSDRNGNGVPGRYNDGYFCTTETNIVDWERQSYFFAMLAVSPNVRVFGVDQTFVDDFRAGLGALLSSGAIDAEQHARATILGAGASGGWQYHHHHSHMSFR